MKINFTLTYWPLDILNKRARLLAKEAMTATWVLPRATSPCNDPAPLPFWPFSLVVFGFLTAPPTTPTTSSEFEILWEFIARWRGWRHSWATLISTIALSAERSHRSWHDDVVFPQAAKHCSIQVRRSVKVRLFEPACLTVSYGDAKNQKDSKDSRGRPK